MTIKSRKNNCFITFTLWGTLKENFDNFLSHFLSHYLIANIALANIRYEHKLTVFYIYFRIYL